MKFIDLQTKYHLTQEKIKIAIAAICIILISIVALVGIKTLLDLEDKAERERRSMEMEALLEGAANTTATEPIETATNDDAIERELDNIVPPTSESSDEAFKEIESTMEDSEGSTTSEAAVTTAEVTTTTTAGVSETPLYMTVYASESLNLRTGPGTDYSLVRVLDRGSAIDVIASTSNGWYKTYNGNYVLASLTQTTPIATPSPVPVATTAAPVETTAAPAATTQTRAPSGSTNNCTITFYGPQPRGDGTYSTTTATGTTCTQGRTCAADWSVYPAGTVIYIENDPLGGDGYYTVEDRGPGVRGNHIDIFVDDVSGYNTTSRNVTAQ